jgi:hypothetical protein
MLFRTKRILLLDFKTLFSTTGKALIFTKKRAFMKYSGVQWRYVGKNV